ncbi:Protein TIC214 [Dillenia turbinata]|uniref:Protein TIC214 n=1 Tax=Dillenia turbinata TaxID=194707 RepID=A0AAN8UXD1_9MAGN
MEERIIPDLRRGNCMKIINSVVVVGLYYGFLTTFSIGPSYLFLLRAQVMEEGEEGTEKKISATTGRIPSPILTKKLKETSETEERDVEIETTSETKETKQEQEGFTKEDPSSSLFSEEKEDPNKIDETEEIRVNGKEKTQDEFHFHFKETCYKNSPVYETSYLDGNQDNSKLKILKLEEDKHLFWFEKPIVTILFDYKRWNRPFRYIIIHSLYI